MRKEAERARVEPEPAEVRGVPGPVPAPVHGPVSWVPTRKWFAAAVTAALTVAGHAVASGGWDATEWGELIAAGLPLVSAYFVPNDP